MTREKRLFNSKEPEKKKPTGVLYWLLLLLWTQVVGGIIALSFYSDPYTTAKTPSFPFAVVAILLGLGLWNALVEGYTTGRIQKRRGYAYRDSNPIDFWVSAGIFLAAALLFSYGFHIELVQGLASIYSH